VRASAFAFVRNVAAVAHATECADLKTESTEWQTIDDTMAAASSTDGDETWAEAHGVVVDDDDDGDGGGEVDSCWSS